MDIADALPDDLAECQRLLVAASKEATQHERRVAELEQSLAASTQHATESEQQAAEFGRVLDETAAAILHRRLTATRRGARPRDGAYPRAPLAGRG